MRVLFTPFLLVCSTSGADSVSTVYSAVSMRKTCKGFSQSLCGASFIGGFAGENGEEGF